MNKSIKDLLFGVKINIVEGDFECSGKELTSLEGAPSIVGRWFDCSDNNLTSLEYAPTKVEGVFNCSGNDKKFTQEEVRKYSKVTKGMYL